MRIIHPRDYPVLTLLVFVYADQFYVFAPRAAPPPPSKLSASDFTPELDLVGAALSRDGPASEDVVSLAGAKSGLRVSFATNRAYPLSFAHTVTADMQTDARTLALEQSPACSSTRTTSRCPRRARGRRSTGGLVPSATVTAPEVRAEFCHLPACGGVVC